jgi:flagellar hook-length control protein FliK
MTPLTFMPTAPPSRPVAPAGGGVADTPSSPSSSFESALQRAGAADDSQRADATPVARPGSDKSAAQSTAPAKRPQDDERAPRDAEGFSDADGPSATPTRTRARSTRDAASGKPESKHTPKDSSGDATLALVVVSVPVQTPQPVVATEPVDLAPATAAIEDGKLSGLSGLSSPKTNAPRIADVLPVAPQAKGKAGEPSKATATDSGKAPTSFESERLVDKSPEEVDLADLKGAPATQPPGQPADVSRSRSSRPSAQAARTLLADALQRAGTPNVQQTQASADARPAAAATPEAVVTAAPAVAAGDVAPQVKAAGKTHGQAPAVQDVTVQGAGSSQHDGLGAGTGGPSTGSGRREGAPMPQPKPDAPVSWPTAFAIRVPEAMTSSLERTSSAAPALPTAVTQSDLANVGPQLVRGLQLQATAGGGDMKMTLTPDHLGSITIEVQVRHDRVSATLTAETPEVRQWIAAHQADLKNSLASVGLSLEDLVVKDEGGGGRQDARDDEQQPPSGRRPRAPDQDEAQFEVLV